ncbi:MAG TPA: hypothetical protein VI980_05160 [Acidimicrobiia bacterium]|nr:hypothetical protein [Acidimicrobiia bacterium]
MRVPGASGNRMLGVVRETERGSFGIVGRPADRRVFGPATSLETGRAVTDRSDLRIEVNQ